jgi:molecular chaperone DnaJ
VRPGTAHGTVQCLRGEGPPRLGGKGRGDIHYRFLIDVPDKLTDEQSAAVDALAEAMNGHDFAPACSSMPSARRPIPVGLLPASRSRPPAASS